MLTRLLIVRPSVRVHAKKDDFVAPADAPGEGKRRFPSEEENKDSAKGVHPIKKFLIEKFNIKEIDYEKFEKDNKWAIRPEHKDKDP